MTSTGTVRRRATVTAAAAPAALWTNAHLAALGVLYAFGLILIGAGTYGAGGTGDQSEGIRWLALSVFGVVLAGIGNGLWVARGRRRVAWRRHQLLSFHRPPKRHVGARRAAVAPQSTAGQLLLTHRNSTRFHREGCELARRRDVRPGSRSEFEAQGLRACAVCEP